MGVMCDRYEIAHSYFLSSFYEGHTMELVTFATRVCKVLGIETMIGMCAEVQSWWRVLMILQ